MKQMSQRQKKRVLKQSECKDSMYCHNWLVDSFGCIEIILSLTLFEQIDKTNTSYPLKCDTVVSLVLKLKKLSIDIQFL